MAVRFIVPAEAWDVSADGARLDLAAAGPMTILTGAVTMLMTVAENELDLLAAVPRAGDVHFAIQSPQARDLDLVVLVAATNTTEALIFKIGPADRSGGLVGEPAGSTLLLRTSSAIVSQYQRTGTGAPIAQNVDVRDPEPRAGPASGPGRSALAIAHARAEPMLHLAEYRADRDLPQAGRWNVTSSIDGDVRSQERTWVDPGLVGGQIFTSITGVGMVITDSLTIDAFAPDALASVSFLAVSIPVAADLAIDLPRSLDVITSPDLSSRHGDAELAIKIISPP